MPRVTTQAVAFARAGLDKIVDIYLKNQPQVFKQYTSDLADNGQQFYRMAQLATLPAATAVNEATGIQTYDLATPYYKDFYYVKRGTGISFATEVLERDMYGVFKNPGTHIANAFIKAWESDCANFINLATSLTTPDGVALASASHPLLTGTASNIITGNPVLSPFSLETALQELCFQLDYNGDYMMFNQPVNLIVPPALYMAACRYVQATQLATTADNDPNVLKARIANVIQSPYFTSSTAWALCVADKEANPLKLCVQRSPRTKSQEDVNFDVLRFQSTSIWFKGAQDWRGFAYSAGA
jgi:hypothetical protein